jgi:hypothetical protein
MLQGLSQNLVRLQASMPKDVQKEMYWFKQSGNTALISRMRSGNTALISRMRS